MTTHSIRFHDHEDIPYGKLPQQVKAKFFEARVFDHLLQEINDDTPVPCAKINWDATDQPHLLRFRALRQKFGDDFTPTLVGFKSSTDEAKDDKYNIMVDFATGLMMLATPISTDEQLDEACKELIRGLIRGEETGRAQARQMFDREARSKAHYN